MRTRRLDGKKLRSVTAVNRSNLWHGAHRWLENSKRERGRFAGLDVVERILPQTTPQESSASLGIHVRDEENDGRTRPLLEAIASSADHGYLIGEGGIGKTTALIHIMNAAYDGKASPPDGQIPIFVELSYAPDTEGELYRGGKSSFIRRSVFRQIMDERAYRQLLHTDVSDMEMVCRLPKAVAVDPINAEFAKRTPQPEYLLLLDGLNEVSTVHLEKYGQSVLEMIIAEIHLLMTEYPNVRLLLTSRSDELTIQDQKLTRYYLSGVEPTDVRRYLEEQGMSAKQVARAMQESTLVEILRIPLFLTMYAALTDKEGVCTRGEILRLFFSERRMHMQLYTSSGRFAQIEHNVWLTSDTQLRRFTKQMQNFILDFILPEIAWYMEREGKFYLSVRMLRRLIRPVLYEKTDHSATGEFGQAVFTQYSQEKARYNTERTAEALRDCLGGVERTVLDGVIDCSAMSLGILQGSGDSYGFIHQHIRDYFAAVRNINALRLAVYMHKEEEQKLALECMNSVFAQRPVGMTVRRFMGEYLGEHHNQPRQTTRGMVYGVPKDPQDRNLIDRALNIYRGVFDGKIGYGLHSLVKILAEVRKTLAGIDFTALDLTRCQLNRTRLGADGLPARLGGAKLGAENLFLPGHRRAISHLAYSPDENRLLSASDDGSVKLWDVLTGELLHSIECGGSVLLAEYIDGGRKILTVEIHEDDRDRTHRICVCLWDSRTFSRMAEITIQGSGCRSSATLSPDGKHLFICGNDKYSMLCLDPLKEIWAREVADYPISMIVHAAFLGAENVQIRFEGLENDTVEVLPVSGGPGDLYDAEESPYGYTCINPLRTEAAVLVCGPDDRCLRIVDLASGKVIREIANRGRYNGRGSSLGYSGNGKWLYAYINDRVELYRTDGYTLAHAFENKWAPYLFNAAEDRLILTCKKTISILMNWRILHVFRGWLVYPAEDAVPRSLPKASGS